MTTLEDLYAQCPSLERTDQLLSAGISKRTWILDLLPKGGVGAELGVFTGLFSQKISQIVRPKQFYLVDVWWKAGEFFGNWGEYTDYGRLPTRVAYAAALIRAQSPETEVIPVVRDDVEWLEGLPDQFLDWIYLDTAHTYDRTMLELSALAPKIKPDGIILGDDWHADTDHKHAGVMLAVNDFVRRTSFDILCAGPTLQWMIKRRRSELPQENS